MEKVFFVENGDLAEVNIELSKGGTIKMISTVAEPMAGGGERLSVETGNIYAYIVIDTIN